MATVADLAERAVNRFGHHRYDVCCMQRALRLIKLLDLTDIDRSDFEEILVQLMNARATSRLREISGIQDGLDYRQRRMAVDAMICCVRVLLGESTKAEAEQILDRLEEELFRKHAKEVLR